MKDPNYYRVEIIKLIKHIVDQYPNLPISSHLSIALSDFPNFDGVSDKEFYFILEKYRCEKELDILPNLFINDFESNESLFDVDIEENFD